MGKHPAVPGLVVGMYEPDYNQISQFAHYDSGRKKLIIAWQQPIEQWFNETGIDIEEWVEVAMPGLTETVDTLTVK